jgi:hypothetical protein
LHLLQSGDDTAPVAEPRALQIGIDVGPLWTVIASESRAIFYAFLYLYESRQSRWLTTKELHLTTS